MKNKEKQDDSRLSLREKAEGILKNNIFVKEKSFTDQENLRLVHELEVHKIELEMQNEELKIAVEQAEITLEKYANLYDFAPLAYYTLSDEYEIVELNIMGGSLIGKEATYLLNRNFGLFVSDDTKLVFTAFVDKVFQTKSAETCEIKLQSVASERCKHVILTGVFTVSENGDNHCLLEAVDITEKTKQQSEYFDKQNFQLAQAENSYRLLAENTIDLVCLMGLDFTFQYVSPSLTVLLGYIPEDLLGKKPKNFVHPEDIKEMATDWCAFISENLNTPIQFRYLNSKGQYIWLETIAKIVFKNEIAVSIQTSTRDISYRKEAEFVTAKAFKRERELNELRTNLVSTISHEFRTPITNIRVSSELMDMYLENQSLDSPQQLRKQTSRITSEIDRIIEFMNAVLVLSKDDSGKTNFKPIKFDLKKLCLNIIKFGFSNNKDNRKVEFHCEGNDYFIFADKKLIEYAISNVLNNAFKYSENCGNVVMRLITCQSEVYLEIQDFGIGVPEKEQQRLFNTFFRASNTDGIIGSGLGLYIVKTFIERNSGTIKLESQLGKGTKVMLQLPKV